MGLKTKYNKHALFSSFSRKIDSEISGGKSLILEFEKSTENWNYSNLKKMLVLIY